VIKKTCERKIKSRKKRKRKEDSIYMYFNEYAILVYLWCLVQQPLLVPAVYYASPVLGHYTRSQVPTVED
jgi:hypothetical protein